MEYFSVIFFLVIIAAVIMESIDSSLGMMYGTILSPFLIGLGFSPVDVVPAIIISQALGGISGSIQHHRFGNTSFDLKSNDLKVGIMIFSFGVIAVILGVFIGTRINPFALSLYIAVLMLCMGILVLSGIFLKFSWSKISVIGLISAFNKALSGGGFGPIITSGQIIVGRKVKNSVGATTMSEAVICITSFIVWLLMNKRIPLLPLMVALCAGALTGGLIGPFLLSRIRNTRIMTRMVAIMAILSGIFALVKIL
jgi:hypothetical protein